MAHYALLDDNNIVTWVIYGIDETETIESLDPETWYGNFHNQRCLRTSVHNNIRKNYAGVGFTYSDELDAFIAPKCHDEAILNENTCQWECLNPSHVVIIDES